MTSNVRGVRPADRTGTRTHYLRTRRRSGHGSAECIDGAARASSADRKPRAHHAIRDPAVPDSLREEAAREVFERLDLTGPNVTAVYPRAEHAWLLGMAAKRSADSVLVGAKGFEPSTS